MRSPRVSLAVLLLGLVFHFPISHAVAQSPREYQLKAVCLWRLAQFTTWPTTAFEDPDSPIVIAVLGENPFGGALNVAVNGETAHGRKLVVHYYRRLAEIRTCHILFISASENRRVKEITAALAGRSILTVSEIEDFARAYGGMVRILTEQGRIKLRINVDAATAARLQLDARLLRAADVVKNE